MKLYPVKVVGVDLTGWRMEEGKVVFVSLLTAVVLGGKYVEDQKNRGGGQGGEKEQVARRVWPAWKIYWFIRTRQE